MHDLIPLGPRELESLSAIHNGGLYLLQSMTTPSLFRLGETDDLSSRSMTHGKGAPKSRYAKAPNWSQVHRPWGFVWALSLPRATLLARRMCEHHLYGVYARNYSFVDHSGFEASSDAVPRLRELANQQRSTFLDIVALQTRAPFDKEAHFAAAWPDAAAGT